MDKAKKSKADYTAYIATAKGAEALKAYKSAKAKYVKLKAYRKATKSVKKDAKLKKPPTAFFSFLSAKRSTIKGKNVADVVKKGAAMWKALGAGGQKSYVDK